jgi:hypothetical protein
MTPALLLLLLGAPASAADLGGHEDPKAEAARPAPVDARRALLEEMWQRRLLPPDQSAWAPKDLELLQKIRGAERAAIAYLSRRPGGSRPWTVRAPSGASRLTKEGFDRYVFLLTQDAILYFESKGADAKWVFKLRDADDKPMFDGAGLLTDEGVSVYERARLNLEVYWRSPAGDSYGTRRPQARPPAKP